MGLNRQIRRAGFVLDCTLDSTEEKGEKVDVAKIISLTTPVTPYMRLWAIGAPLVTG